MSGHSKWATIKHQKGAADAKRGKVFSRISKMISMAVKEGGSDDPGFNPKLRMYIDKAKASNMPKDKIQGAIDKGAGRVEGAEYEEIIYEGFGPNKVAMMIEVVTDNRNRTNSELKTLISKNGGVSGSKGSVAYFFDRKGVITLPLAEGQDPEEMQLELIDYGAEDFKIEEGQMKMIVDASSTSEIVDKMKEAGVEVDDFELAMVPNSHVELGEKEYDQFIRFFEVVDDYEDVQTVYHNAKKTA